MAINEAQKWPTDKAKYDKNYQKIFGEIKMTRKRVKCANCGTIYDIKPEGDMVMVMSSGICPKCGSNAYDVVKNLDYVWKQM